MTRTLLLFAMLLALHFPASAQDDTFTCPDDFTGYLEPQQVMDQFSTTLVQLNLRPEPSTVQARIDVLPDGLLVEITDGPRCNEGFVWWQVERAELTGWVAEGSLNDDEYWLEPRGELLRLTDEDGNQRDFIRDADGNLEPAGCARPPEDYARVQLGYATLNERTLAMLDNAQRVYEANGGEVVTFRQSITQGSYNPGGVSASFGTHDGGGAVDLSVRSYLDWSVLEDEIEPMIEALRVAGFAAWLRDTGELYPDSPIHIHAIAVGDAELSPIAREQIDGAVGYLRGFNGLPQDDGVLPIEDRYEGPVICNWMRDTGFDDFRNPAQFFDRGQIFMTEGDYPRALDNLTTAIELDDAEALFYAVRGDIYTELGESESALADYARFLELGDEDDTLYDTIADKAAQLAGG